MPVHGGLAEPVDRRVPLSKRGALLDEAEKLPSLCVTKADVSTVHRIADGTLSPLEGPMGEEAWNRALDEKVILSQGRAFAWTIPLALPVTDAEAAEASKTRDAIASSMESTMVDEATGKDRFLFLPTSPGPPLASGADAQTVESFRNRQLRLTAAAGLARLPQATVPVPRRSGPPLGLSVVGPRGTDEALLRLACELERALKERP